MISARPVMLITGASRGLGAAAAKEAASRGARLVINARNAQLLEMVAEECRSLGAETLTVAGDIADEATSRQMVQKATQAFGHIDAVIHNAGIIQPLAKVVDMKPAAWEYNWKVNFLGGAMLVSAAIPLLREAKGRVVMVSSGAAIHPYPTWGAYCSAKAALNHFVAVLAVEEPQITAVAFRPGIVDTDMQAVIREEGKDVMPPELHYRFLEYQREGRLAPPEEVAAPLVAVALRAPRAWSGKFIAYYSAEVQALLD